MRYRILMTLYKGAGLLQSLEQDGIGYLLLFLILGCLRYVSRFLLY